jgi:PPOX class probable F420-dependent enzyme
MDLPQAARAVLESDRVAHVVTLNPDGSPQVSCVWVGVEDGDVVFASIGRRQKLDNLRRDRRVVLSMETGRRNPMGLDEYLVVHGRAGIEPGGAPELLQRLAVTYLGPGIKFPPMPDPPPGHVVRVAVERLGGVGPWTEA